jgi:MFS transporter, ACS family, tartrate transporter
MQLRSDRGALVSSNAVEKSAMRKIYLRLLPFAVLAYILAYVGRINISFAAFTMRGDLDMSASAFGFAAGMFFWGYFIFEVPSNLILERVGARVWIARIMISWGIVAGLTALVVGTTSFVVVRFLLGVCEAGFFPGLLLYFTYWFPSRHHARIVSGFMIGLPIAVALGAPVSTALLNLDGLFGLRGWQVVYIAEAIPTVVLGILTLFLLTDRPEQAKFLTSEERDWLSEKLTTERKAKEAVRTFTLWQALRDVKVLLLSVNYFGIVTASLGMRRWHLLAACTFAAAGLVLAGMTMGTWWALAGMSIAAMGFYGSKGPFFAMPPMFLSGTGLAAGIAWINSLGNLGGFFGPWYVGLMKDWTASYSGGLHGLALTALVSAFVCAFFLHIPNRTVPEAMVAVPAHAG